MEEAAATAARLNRGACEAMNAVGPSAATDVTGYGLLGHIAEMLLHAGLGACNELAAVPVWDGAPELDTLYVELDELRGAFLTAARSALA